MSTTTPPNTTPRNTTPRNTTQANTWPRDLSRAGFTFVELLVVIAVIGVLLALLLPGMRFSGDAARRMSCANNLKQLGIGSHNYHDVYKCLPAAMGGTGHGATPALGNANRLSGLVALLPYVEQGQLWEVISSASEFDGTTYPAMGPAPWIAEYPPWQKQLPVLRCPTANSDRTKFGLTNYAFCIGDTVREIHEPTELRGAFASHMYARFEDVKDGTSNTIAMGEIGTPSRLSLVGQFATNQPLKVLTNPSLCLSTREGSGTKYRKDVVLGNPGRGGRWADGAAGVALFNTVLPPNSPSCAVNGREAVDGIYSAGSYHESGSQIVFVDGSVRFIAETIDAGDPTQPPPADHEAASPYGVWGALGTLAGGEDVETP